VIALLVEGPSDAGFVEELCKKIGVRCEVYVLRGNRVEKAIRMARSLAGGSRRVSHIFLLKDTHGTSDKKLASLEMKVNKGLRDLVESGVKGGVLKVNRSIESWILAGLCEENPEGIPDPERRLSGRIGRPIIKAEESYRILAGQIDIQHAETRSQSFREFVKALRGCG